MGCAQLPSEAQARMMFLVDVHRATGIIQSEDSRRLRLSETLCRTSFLESLDDPGKAGGIKVSTSTAAALFLQMALTGQRIAMVDLVFLVFTAFAYLP